MSVDSFLSEIFIPERQMMYCCVEIYLWVYWVDDHYPFKCLKFSLLFIRILFSQNCKIHNQFILQLPSNATLRYFCMTNKLIQFTWSWEKEMKFMGTFADSKISLFVTVELKGAIEVDCLSLEIAWSFFKWLS